MSYLVARVEHPIIADIAEGAVVAHPYFCFLNIYKRGGPPWA
ncbi:MULTISPECIES: hypothetical protein [Pseudomonas]|jgi:hypothetical protein|nr:MULTISPECIES: hypothetical protein [Pseudomonas]